jgi:hypothetical protein
LRLIEKKDHDASLLLGSLNNLQSSLSNLVHQIEASKNQTPVIGNIEAIENDPYKLSFYETLVRELNANFLTAQILHNGWVDCKKSGTLGSVASVMGLAGTVCPGGSVIKVLAKVMKEVDKAHQKLSIANFSKLALTVSNMEKLSADLAVSLLKSNLEIRGKEAGFVRKFQNYLLKLDAKIKAEDMREMFGFMATSYPNDAVSKGYYDAKIVAQYLTTQILAGKLKQRQNASDKMAKLVLDEFADLQQTYDNIIFSEQDQLETSSTCFQGIAHWVEKTCHFNFNMNHNDDRSYIGETEHTPIIHHDH